MNFHPLFVHFPIAFLCFYSVLEILRIPVLTRQQYYFPLKAILLLAGVAGAFVSLQTGEVAEHALQDASLHDLVETHSLFANVTTYLYAFAAACYLIAWIGAQRVPSAVRNAWSAAERVARWIISGWAAPVLAAVSFASMLVVGALGGALVYGPDVDPVVRMIYDAVM